MSYLWSVFSRRAVEVAAKPGFFEEPDGTPRQEPLHHAARYRPRRLEADTSLATPIRSSMRPPFSSASTGSKRRIHFDEEAGSSEESQGGSDSEAEDNPRRKLKRRMIQGRAEVPTFTYRLDTEEAVEPRLDPTNDKDGRYLLAHKCSFTVPPHGTLKLKLGISVRLPAFSQLKITGLRGIRFREMPAEVAPLASPVQVEKQRMDSYLPAWRPLILLVYNEDGHAAHVDAGTPLALLRVYNTMRAVPQKSSFSKASSSSSPLVQQDTTVTPALE